MVDPATPVQVDVDLEAVPDGVTVTGAITARWSGPCHLCLDEVSGDLVVNVQEVFSDVVGGEDDLYPLGREDLDLGPMVSDVLLLELPLLARCPFGGAGVCDRAPELAAFGQQGRAGDASEPVAEPVPERTELADQRWAALDALRFEDPG